MATTADIRNGAVILHKNKRMKVVEFQHVKPGKGGAFVRTKLRNVQTGAVIDRTFRSGDKVENIRLEKREMQYLYSDGDLYHFMDMETYEQLGIASDILGERANLLKENESAFLLMAENKPITAELPNFVNHRCILSKRSLTHSDHF